MYMCDSRIITYIQPGFTQCMWEGRVGVMVQH